ncbi:GPMC system MBL fold metallohydrolase [Trichloromonas sp.]|uniref:GPMC system MBL fold metallohydrolase n=1 Tax=Trichloromonas sp. TaxID=3069249 RepID=UPI003D81568B
MSGQRVTVTILGSGTSTGVPVPACSCPVCSSRTPQNQRTRCSILISFAGRNILVDTSTDLRQQSLREQISRIDAVLYTHTHADHVNGIDDLRPFNLASGEAIPIYGSREDLDVLRRVFAYIFDDGDEPGYRPRLQPQPVSDVFTLFGLEITPLPLLHGPGRSFGYRIGPFAYLTDCSSIPETTLSALAGIDILVIDGLRFRPHASHLSISEALAFAERIGARQTILTHLSHDVDYSRHASLMPAGTELAYDGQRLVFQLDPS